VGNGRGFRRGLSVSNGERVLIVDDILTTGGSVEDVMKAVKDEGGNVLGVGVLIDRSARSIDLGAALYSCHSMEIPTFSSNECPKCHEGSPLTRPGGRL
jgi:orotate phosphoribosyltransferase